MKQNLRLAFSVLFGFLPSPLAAMCYRLFFGYKIGKRFRIGFSALNVSDCEIGEDVSIGHLNLLIGTKTLFIGEHTRIGHLNILRGGDEIRIGRYCDILRQNEINSIPEPDVVNEIDPRFIMGDGSMIGASHKIDFTDRVEFGRRVILGGRNSSIWTHNRQMTLPVAIGDYSYIGSEIRIAPGGSIPARCIVGIGTVVTKRFETENTLIAGVPAVIVKDLGDEGRFLTENRTRKDLPDSI